ncbi:MAG: ABC transporter permease, partial [Actinomycetota bacterium]|nr:ABC transporter permease [Actinomycetota bacterium]
MLNNHNNNKRKFSMSRLWTPILIVVLLLIFEIQFPNFLSATNISNLLTHMTILLTASMGMSLIILMGSIDVSVGATLSITAMAAAMTSSIFGGASIIVGILVGTLVGIINGFLATFLKIPTFLSTIAMMGILNGVTVLILKGSPYNITSDSFIAISKGSFLFGISNLITIPIIVVIVALLITKRTVLGRIIYA